MTKGTKKGLTVAGIIVAIILVLMVAIPFLFKDKIKDAVLDIANENLNATVAIEDFGLNLFSNFPNATLTLKNATVIGINDFANDTLVQAKNASVTIDLASLFGDNYKISKISLDNASVYAKILADGKPNWDIVKSDSTVVEETTSDDSAFNLALKDISIKNSNIYYEDLEGKMKAEIIGWNGSVSGDLSTNETTIKTKSSLDAINFTMDGIPFMKNVKGLADASIKADLDKMKFTFEKSKVSLNDLKAGIDGSIALIGEDGMDFDLTLNAPDVNFKQILSLVPAMYNDEFKDIKTAGKVSLSAYLKGLMEGETFPAIDLRLAVTDAMFKYPTLPKSIDDINLNLSVNGAGGAINKVIVLIDKFGFKLGGNPFSGSFRMVPAGDDTSIKFNALGSLDLGMIKEVYPFDKETDLRGKINADLRVSTTMNAIEKENYEAISAEGHLKLGDMLFKSKEMDDVLINNAGLEFTPKHINLSDLDLKIGESDIAANGKLENYMAYIFNDKTLKGQLNIKSSHLNLDKLMGEDEAPVDVEEVDERTEDFIVPKNIDFALNAAFKEIIFSKIAITNMSGGIFVKDGVVSLNKVVASALSGLCNVSGAYNTTNPKDPKVNFDLGLTKVSFAETFKAVDAVKKFAPIFEDLTGSYSMSLKFNANLRPTTSETLNSLNANGSLMTSEVKLENNKMLTALGSALKTDKLDKIAPKDINLPFTIKDGALSTKPFSLNLGNGGEMKLEGVTKLDQTIDYKGTIQLPKSLDNKFISSVPFTVGGAFGNPKIGLDTKAAITDVVGKLLGGKDGEDMSAKISEEKTKQIAKLREQADKAAIKLVEIAKEQANNLEEKAGSNKIAKAAAKGAGKKLIEEAEKQAKKLRDEAEIKIKQLEGEQSVEQEQETTPAE